jgi:phosphoribosylamine--glycine ligase
MKIMVVGGGGREHAIIKKLKENKNVTEIYALPGNGGIAADAICVDIGAKDIERIVDFAVQSSIDYAVVAPDDPLVLGAVDALEKKGIICYNYLSNKAGINNEKLQHEKKKRWYKALGDGNGYRCHHLCYHLYP